MPTQKIQANGITFNISLDGVDADQDDAPWLTFSNSLATNHRMWDEQIATFGKTFRILRYDTRGHGETDAPPGPYDFDLLIADIIGLWDAVGIERSHFCGLSLGGMTGMGLALKHPDRVASLIACDCRAVGNEHFAALWAQNIPLVEQNGTAAIADATMGRWFNEAWADANGERFDGVRKMVLTTPAAGYAGCAAAIQHLDYLKDLGKLTTPALFIGGAQDVGAPVDAMDEMHAASPGSKRAIIDPAAHIANIENTPVFNDAVMSFLNGL